MGYAIVGIKGSLGSNPFLSVLLTASQANALIKELRRCGAQPRHWFTLVATRENPRRLRLKAEPTPEFEEDASPLYLRGDILRVTGTEGTSCNIAFSNFAAMGLAERIEEAAGRMRNSLELRVRSRRRSLVEIIPDVDAAIADAPELDGIGRAGAILAGSVLPIEDFSDWET